MYPAYQWQEDIASAWQALARVNEAALDTLPDFWQALPWVRLMHAGDAMVARSGLTHERPAFGIDHVTIDGAEVDVDVSIADPTPFGNLLSFSIDRQERAPRVLLVAPLSGHFSTLLRDTVQTLLTDHDVYLTDWANARNVGLVEGGFGFDDYVDLLMRWLRRLGPGTHLMAVCQPCVAAVAATALLAADGDPATPPTLTLMAGPIDARINPTKVNEFATGERLSWFENNFITTVPGRYRGAGRRVFPGFLQVGAFMSMNLDRHVEAHRRMFFALLEGDHESFASSATFYDEYFAVLDLPAEFYLETVDRVFQRFELALGTLRWRGRLVEPAAITKTALLTVEGERDDICAVGQTMAAHDLCANISPRRKRHHLQTGVGHYGVFSGSRWQTSIYPAIRNFVLAHD